MADTAPRKPKTQRAKRFLKNRESKINENTKSGLFIKGHRTSQLINSALRELWMLKKPDGRQLIRQKNVVKPFEDETSLEFLTRKNDTSLFAIGSHTKRRPQNLIVGRMYDFHILDMFEFGVESFKSLQDFKNEKSAVGNKPCFIFQGDLFDSDANMQRAKSLLLDFFRGSVVDKVALAGLDHVIVCTAMDPTTVLFRHYRIDFKKSGSRLPLVQLTEIGPSMNLKLRRTHLAPADLYKEAHKQPRAARKTKVKNESTNVLGERRGRIHMERQDLDKLALKRSKALKTGTAPETIEATAEAEEAEAEAEAEGVVVGGRGAKRKREVEEEGEDEASNVADPDGPARRPGKRKKKSVQKLKGKGSWKGKTPHKP